MSTRLNGSCPDSINNNNVDDENNKNLYDGVRARFCT